jgi:dolichyl-phosphate-mannose--protein O-mannosyl transferase
MACFLVPVGEAILTTVAQKVVENREKKAGGERTENTGVKWSQRLGWLNKMLWGGSAMLAVEHIWHGEVVPWPPFLTAMETPGEAGPMIHEMATYGVTMAVVVTVVWAIIVVIAELRAKAKALPKEEAHVVGGGA